MSKEWLFFKLRVLLLVLLACGAWLGKAQASGYLPPRLSMEANAGGFATVGQADLLLSLKGDERLNLYLDPQVAYGTDEQWYTDLGLGYRWIQNDAAILGAYLFGGYSQVTNQSRFWIANPGVEVLGSRWDARINGYIPIGGRSDDLGAFQFIQSNQFISTGHTATLFMTYLSGKKTQQIGDGIDGKVAYQVFRNVPFKAYLGAYFFDIPHTHNVHGGAAGLEYWFDQHVKVFANYTYDNLQHNTVAGGLAVSFGGVGEARADPSLSERLTDPVERYLANLGHAAGIPSETLLSNLKTGTETALNNRASGGTESESELLDSNVAYFSQAGTPNNGGVGLTLANCTFENPCGPTDFSQTGVNTLSILLPNTVMFFNAGTYSVVNGASALTLTSGQGVFGRVADYSSPASGAARPTFNGAFILTGNNTLDSIILNNSLGAAATAITSSGGQNLVINNTNIGSTAIPYGRAINLTNASVILRQSSADVSAQPGTGISLSGSSLLTIQSSNINVINNLPSAYPIGIYLINNSSLVLNNSSLNVSGTAFGAIVAGLVLTNNSTVLINNSSISVQTPLSTTANGFETYNTSGVQMNGDSLTVSGATDSSLFVQFSTSTVVFSASTVCTRNTIVGC